MLGDAEHPQCLQNIRFLIHFQTFSIPNNFGNNFIFSLKKLQLVSRTRIKQSFIIILLKHSATLNNPENPKMFSLAGDLIFRCTSLGGLKALQLHLISLENRRKNIADANFIIRCKSLGMFKAFSHTLILHTKQPRKSKFFSHCSKI